LIFVSAAFFWLYFRQPILQINVTLTPINQEGFAHESFGNVDLRLADVARLLGNSNS
jgi:hypothetical protein